MKLSPGRKIPKNYRNITGVITSEKSSNSIAFESKLERDYYMVFELEPNIIYIKDQPFTLKSSMSGLKYTPDFEIHILKNGIKEVIIGEAKYKKDLKEDWNTLRPKFEMAIEYAKSRENTSFKIFTNTCSKISNPNYLFNTHFLLSYKNYDHKAYTLLKKHFKKNISVNDLLNRCSNDDTVKLKLLTTLWYLIRREAIKTDLYQKLSLSTVLLSFNEYAEPEPLQLISEKYSM